MSQPRTCERCGAPMADEAVICIECGFDTRTGEQLWPTVAAAPKPVPPPIPPDDDQTLSLEPEVPFQPPPEPVSGLQAAASEPAEDFHAFCARCRDAWRFATTNFGAIGRLVFFWMILSIALQFGLQYIGPLMFFGPIGWLLLLGAMTLTMLILSGYTLQFYFNTVIGSLEGLDEAPDCPPWAFRNLLATGAWGLAIFIVYVLPVVTIPLLPLGVLAYVHCNDGRCLDLTWALRAARQRPNYLAALWAYLLLWGAVAAVTLAAGSVLLSLVTAALMATEMCLAYLGVIVIVLVGFGLIMTVAVAFVCMQFRCIGMLGRFCPDLLETLPPRTNVARSAAALAAGTVIGIGLLVLAAWSAAAGISEMDPHSGQQSAAQRETAAGNEAISGFQLHLCFRSASRYAATHASAFPPDLRTIAKGQPPQIIRSPGKTSTFMVYVPGLTLENDPATILLYDPVPYVGRYQVLLVGGDLVSLPREQLQQRLLAQNAPPIPD